MSSMISFLVWCSTYASIFISAKPAFAPFVVLPPSFHINAINTFIVAPIKNKHKNVDIHIRIAEYKDNRSSVIFTKKLRGKRAGVPHSVSFDLTSSMEKAKVYVDVQGHSKFESELRVKPNLAAIHIHTDKPTYSSGETVHVRALPLTYEGLVYGGTIEFVLVNPGGFELVKKYNTTSQGYIALTFDLPRHLLYGDWRILARPQGMNDRGITHDVIFKVEDYVLPPFKIIAHIPEGQSIESTEILVEARYYYGAPLSGSMTLYCSKKRRYEAFKPTQLLQSQITDGVWRQSVNLSVCFSDNSRENAIISVEILDGGTGNSGHLAVIFDPLSPGFEIVPIRPVFSGKTRNILILTYSNGAANDAVLNVTLHCLGDVIPFSMSAETLVGEVLTFTIPADWDRCHVIFAQATRLMGTVNSRAQTLMLPLISDVSSIEPSWIEISSPRATYTVGESLKVTLPRALAGSLNYLILCNSQSIAEAGQIRDDGTLIVKVTTAMIGRCILFVYSLSNKPTTDMVHFNVIEQCQVSVFSSHDTIKPGSTVTFTFNGKPHGIALVRAMDDRLNFLVRKNPAVREKSWDFDMFNCQESKGDQATLLNFVVLKEVKKALELSCALGASSYFQRFGACPDAKITQSALSNFCLNVMVAKCMNPEQPTVAVSTACDAKNPRNCESGHLKKATSAFEHLPSFHAVREEADKLADMLSDSVKVDDDAEPKVRERFHEVWLFDAIHLGTSGNVSKTLKAPDTVGRWSVSSVFWALGQRHFCLAPDIQIIAKKNVFLEVDVPKSVYVNETVTAKVSVIARNPMRETKYSVCLSEISRKICADLGSFGQLGQPSYSRVVVSPSQPIYTKTFTLRFLSTGSTTVTFQLKEETSFPGKHHCDIGKMYDSVRLNIFIAKRDETEEIYKKLILNANKPLIKIKMSDVVDNGASLRDIFQVTKYRSPVNVDVMVTDVRTNILDADAVYSFTIDISKFLPIEPLDVSIRRSRRNLENEHFFLSDILKQFSVELYQFKKIMILRDTDFGIMGTSDNRIGSLISDMLRFSDCRNELACGYSEYMAPTKPEERSIALTAVATSLICESSSDSRLVCGGIRFLIQSFLKDWTGDDFYLKDLVHLGHAVDREWFLKALLLQVSRDCSAYQCVKNDEAWLRLLSSFYSIDENWKWDIRSLAALAYMGTNATSEVMRIKMAGMANRHLLPFWNVGSFTFFSKQELNTFDESSQKKRMKSGDTLVNSLGILAFVSSGAEGRNVDWDPLANWLYEQQLEDGTYENAIDTYFASRALFEYRFRKVDITNNGGVKVTVRCATCETRVVNVTEAATEIYLPVRTRNFTLETKGHGKVKVGIRVIARKRHRSRRGLTKDDYYPLRISVTQERIYKGTIRQTVCLRPLSPLVNIVELIHGLYTGYSTTPSNVAILANSSSLSFVSLPTISSFAVHFVLNGFQHNNVLCYAVGVIEPEHSHEPLHLAPVAITARHPVDDVIGLVLISHPDQDFEAHRSRRHARQEQIQMINPKRNSRGIIDESIDTVCFEGGQCSCAESTCGVKCGLCARDNSTDIKTVISTNENFGVFLRVHSVHRVLVARSFYTHLRTEVREKRGQAVQFISDKLDIWLRECNPRCIAKAPAVNDSFFLLGEAAALSVDSHGVQQYVLRNVDRFERAAETCTALANVIVLG